MILVVAGNYQEYKDHLDHHHLDKQEAKFIYLPHQFYGYTKNHTRV
jgi:hypothetical protein